MASGVERVVGVEPLVELVESSGGVATVRLPLTGFTTTGELRRGGRRAGFVVEDMAGRQGLLALVQTTTGPRVGRYRVDMATFEAVALPALGAAWPEMVTVTTVTLANRDRLPAQILAVMTPGRARAPPEPGR